MKRGAIAAALAMAAVALLAIFYAIGRDHEGYALRYVGTTFIDRRELFFLGAYGLLGTLAALCAAPALLATVGRALAGAIERALERPARLAWMSACIAALASIALRVLLLRGQPIADDESTYVFIAQTLLEGRVVNPLPLPAEFLQNQFVVINERGWFGKYPPGHPALLALGMLLGAEQLVVPLLGGLGVWLTFLVGRELFGPRRAAGACALLLLSPQYLATNATMLSQTTSMVCMLLGMLGVLRLRGSSRGGIEWALCAGAAFGYGILARPLPGALFAACACASYVLDTPRPRFRAELGHRAREIAAAALPLLALASLLLLVNAAQSGAATRSGYHEYHAGGLGVGGIAWHARLSSMGDALLRQAFWLLGAPLLVVFAVFARVRRGALLFWGMIAAGYAYRLLVPKTVLATTGPIYVMEIVPLLSLAVADGLARARGWGNRGTQANEATARVWAASLLASSVLVSALCFLPVQARAIAAGAHERAQVFEQLEATGARDAVVFAFDNLIVLPTRRRTWAYYAPTPHPRAHEGPRDRPLFLRAPPDDARFARCAALWRHWLSDRRAFVLLPSPQGPVIRELAPPRGAAAGARDGAP